MSTNQNEFLFEKIEKLIEDGFLSLPALPSYITNNLSPNILLREYQIEAFQHFLVYSEDERLRKNKQLHLLFHMATGSGKTVIMAGLMMHLFKKGYKNFVFFVDTNNIIEKTKSNFLENISSKYLFAEKIIIDAEEIIIKEVTNFQDNDSDSNCINLKFTTIQKLHDDLNKAKENNVTMSDFEDDKVVLIADEAHHINSETKSKLDSDELKEKDSWENSVRRIFSANKDNVLLEFTATADIKNPAIREKYSDKIVYDYPLLKFRESGYTKDFINFQSNHDELNRVIVAMLLSQYRLKLFQAHGLNKKPAILLKSKTIKSSNEFYDTFVQFIEKQINETHIDAILSEANDGILLKMKNFFVANGIDSQTLVLELKYSFAESHLIIMNSKDDASVEKQRLVNDLENLKNPIRMIFTVDMLNEGWDVLNLYDIVRLYETRQGGKKISKTTISEAQLIGRGARYYPFQIKATDEKFKRKYDADTSNEMRFCETLLYHSKEDSKYIQELREALKEIGFEPKTVVEFEYILKDSFKDTDLYKHGKIFGNNRVLKDKTVINSLPSNFIRETEIDLTNDYKELSLVDTSAISTTKTKFLKVNKKIKDLFTSHPHVTIKAFRQFQVFKFSTLKSYFPNLQSLYEFIASDDYAGKIEIKYKISSDEISNTEIYKGLIRALSKLSDDILSITEEYAGTEEFTEFKIKDFIKSTPRKKSEPDDEGEGISQNAPSINPKYKLDLSDKDWFAYQDNFGTTEEKKFVKFFADRIDELKKKYDEVYLVRNERSFHVFSFKHGLRFEPDYLIITRSKGQETYNQKQVFIEPKGSHLLMQDKWKEDALIEMEAKAKPILYHEDENGYEVIGLPFYNSDDIAKFKEEFERLIL